LASMRNRLVTAPPTTLLPGSVEADHRPLDQ
jgi:hypothetical protein